MSHSFRPFTGAKIALLSEGKVVTYLRAAKPGIPFPNMWDLAGGGRAGSETPEGCALRETEEEFGLRIDASRIVWCRRYPHATKGDQHAYFMVAPITSAEVASIRFGDEGQHWQMMKISTFVQHPDAVPPLRERLKAYLAHAKS